jgi:general stress protein YciG
MDRHAAAGAKGGKATFDRYGRKHMQEIGGKGFAATVAAHWQGDRKAYHDYLAARQWNRLADSFADRELQRRLDAGEQVACIELPVQLDADGDVPF